MGTQEKEEPLATETMELMRAEERLTQLGSLLKGTEGSLLAEEARVSISKVLSMLLQAGARRPARGDPGSVGSPCSDEVMSEISTAKRRGKQAAGGGDRRAAGNLRRRNRSHPYLTPSKTSKTLDDGYTWRKYGQKEIQNSLHPRGYYRCTHKHDRGCQAQRQVQKKEDDPSTYIITYIGQHTCRDTHPIPFVRPTAPAAAAAARDLYMINFGSRDPSSSLLPSVVPKQEPVQQDAGSSLTTSLGAQSSPTHSTVPEMAVAAVEDASTSGLGSCMGSTNLEEDDFAVDSIWAEIGFDQESLNDYLFS